MFISTTGSDICPFGAMQEFVARRGTAAGAFFWLVDSTPLMKRCFEELVREALVQTGVPRSGYSGHIFRIGAATAAAQAGIPDSTIQALGRWSSPAFLRYIRTPREHLAQFSHSIVQPPRRR